MFTLQMLVKTPLGLSTGKIQEFKSEKDRAEVLEAFTDLLSKLTYLKFENDVGQIIVLSKEVIQNSVFVFETKP